MIVTEHDGYIVAEHTTHDDRVAFVMDWYAMTGQILDW